MKPGKATWEDKFYHRRIYCCSGNEGKGEKMTKNLNIQGNKE
jgi:hypothetical protein